MAPFIDRWNQDLFRGELSGRQLELLGGVRDFPTSTHDFIEGVLRRMSTMGIPARDLGDATAWVIGSLLPRLLPTAWGGMVPPITVQRRHIEIDRYIATNRWCVPRPGETIVDLGCGFPPLTAVDLAKAFPGNPVIGVDPSFGRDLVYDEHGDYACFTEEGRMRYFQVGQFDLPHFDELYGNPERTREHFASLHRRLVTRVEDPASDRLQEVHEAGCRLIRNPLRHYERDNLRFEQSGVGELHLPESVRVVRCMNVLFYFDLGFRRQTHDWVASILGDGGIFVAGADWVRSSVARYSVWQRVGDELLPREFAFSLDNVCAQAVVPYFAFHDDDYETQQLVQCVATLRADAAFVAAYDDALDRLYAEHGVASRDDSGYLMLSTDLSAAQSEELQHQIFQELAGSGLRDEAVRLLRVAGHEAWVNEVGHIAIAPPPLSRPS